MHVKFSTSVDTTTLPDSNKKSQPVSPSESSSSSSSSSSEESPSLSAKHKEAGEHKHAMCLKCKEREIEFETDSCHHACFCRTCAMKCASGGKCKICNEFYAGLQRIRYKK